MSNFRPILKGASRLLPWLNRANPASAPIERRECTENRAVALAQADVAEQQGDLPAFQAALEQSVDRYHGDLLPGCYDDWIIPERERLRHLFVTALERLVVILEAQRYYRRAVTIMDAGQLGGTVRDRRVLATIQEVLMGGQHDVFDFHKIAFTRRGADSLRIGVMNIDGSGQNLLTTGPRDEGPSWAASSRELIFQRGAGNGSAIFRITLDGSDPRQMNLPQGGSDPDWSGVMD